MLALIESGLQHTVQVYDVRSGRTQTPEYMAINPWAKVPALQTEEGPLLTENVAILTYIADKVTEKNLLPASGTFARAQALSFMALLSSTVHIAFRPILRPEKFASTPEGRDDVTQTGLVNLDKVLTSLENEIQGEQSVLPGGFSLCDYYALVFAHWSLRPQVAGRLSPTPRLYAVARAMHERPAVKSVFPDGPDFG
ncbi:glutathione S-transferase N-terminal domain-containing protein [Sphingopyxis indica]|nr:glutathione S-transferase N-terminal domain-containing protein [Sphingopyxis indica]